MTLVFVYGTLMRGERYHAWLDGAELLGAHETAPSWSLVHLGEYPAVLPGGRTRVVGEVFRVSARTLARLDELEEVPREYRRDRITTPWGDAWLYVYQGALTGTPILGGDWREIRATQSAGSLRSRTIARTESVALEDEE